jgi:hypothetical protein
MQQTFVSGRGIGRGLALPCAIHALFHESKQSCVASKNRFMFCSGGVGPRTGVAFVAEALVGVSGISRHSVAIAKAMAQPVADKTSTGK